MSQAPSLRDQVLDPRRKDPRPRTKFKTFENLGSEAYKTHVSETSESEALVSETLEFRDRGFKFYWIIDDVILSIQFKSQAPRNMELDTLSAEIQNSKAITTKSYLDLLRSRDG